MSETGIEWVGVHYWWQQDAYDSKVIYPQTAPEVPDLFDLFDLIHAQGMKIMFKPMLSLQDGNWRSFIKVSDEWLSEYARIIRDAAEMADNGSVEMLSIGCEMGSWQVHTDEARSLIADVRNIFSGLLTYSANHDSFWEVEFWDDLDIIGIDAYYAFTTVYDPTYEEMLSVWNGFYDRLNKFQRYWNKPIAFMEIGRSGRDGNNIGHFFESSEEQDIWESQLFYQTFFNSRIWTAPWFKGVYWWMWDTMDYAPEEDVSMAPDHPVIKFTIAENYAEERSIIYPNYIIQIILLVILGIMMLAALFTFYKKNPDSIEENPVIDVHGNREEPTSQICNLSEDRLFIAIGGVTLGSQLFWLSTYFNELVFTSFINWTIFLSTRSSVLTVLLVLVSVGTAVLSIIGTRKLLNKTIDNNPNALRSILITLYGISGSLIFILESVFADFSTHNMSWLFMFITSQLMIIQLMASVLFIRYSNRQNTSPNENDTKRSRLERKTIHLIIVVAFLVFLLLSCLIRIHSRVPSMLIGSINFGVVILLIKNPRLTAGVRIASFDFTLGRPFSLYALGYYFGILPFYDRHALFTFNLPLLSSFFVPVSISVLVGAALIVLFRDIAMALPKGWYNYAFENPIKISWIFGISVLLLAWLFPGDAHQLVLIVGGIPMFILFFMWIRHTIAWERTEVDRGNLCPRKFYYLLLIGFTLNAGMIGIIAVYPYLGVTIPDIVRLTHNLQFVVSIILCLGGLILYVRHQNQARKRIAYDI